MNSFSVSTSESENQVKGRLLLDVVIGEGSAVLELLTSEDESLLVWWDTFLVLDLSLDILDGVSWLDVKSDGLSGKGLNKDLHFVRKLFEFIFIIFIGEFPFIILVFEKFVKEYTRIQVKSISKL